MQIRRPLGGERIYLLWPDGGRGLFHRSQAVLELLDTLLCGVKLPLYRLRVRLLGNRGY
jgi:hypothetical protein